jgi:hypothetical protein
MIPRIAEVHDRYGSDVPAQTPHTARNGAVVRIEYGRMPARPYQSVDDLVDTQFRPGPGRRLGVLVDHLVARLEAGPHRRRRPLWTGR